MSNPLAFLPALPSPVCSPLAARMLTPAEVLRATLNPGESQTQLLGDARLEAVAVAVRGVEISVVGPSDRPVVAPFCLADDARLGRPRHALDHWARRIRGQSRLNWARRARCLLRQGGKTPRRGCPIRRVGRPREAVISPIRRPAARRQGPGWGRPGRSYRPGRAPSRCRSAYSRNVPRPLLPQ